jgi:hypothetical protein
MCVYMQCKQSAWKKGHFTHLMRASETWACVKQEFVILSQNGTPCDPVHCTTSVKRMELYHILTCWTGQYVVVSKCWRIESDKMSKVRTCPPKHTGSWIGRNPTKRSLNGPSNCKRVVLNLFRPESILDMDHILCLRPKHHRDKRVMKCKIDIILISALPWTNSPPINGWTKHNTWHDAPRYTF